MSSFGSNAIEARPAGFGRVRVPLTVGFGVAFVILGLLGWLALQSADEARANAREVERTFELLGITDAILGRVRLTQRRPRAGS
jgi:hypothetical protein